MKGREEEGGGQREEKAREGGRGGREEREGTLKGCLASRYARASTNSEPTSDCNQGQRNKKVTLN